MYQVGEIVAVKAKVICELLDKQFCFSIEALYEGQDREGNHIVRAALYGRDDINLLTFQAKSVELGARSNALNILRAYGLCSIPAPLATSSPSNHPSHFLLYQGTGFTPNGGSIYGRVLIKQDPEKDLEALFTSLTQDNNPRYPLEETTPPAELKTRLFSHQKKALCWMLRKEQSEDVSFPYIMKKDDAVTIPSF
jgi:hypothetical protein